MKLKDFNFNEIQQRGLAIYVEGELITSGFIKDVLESVPYLKDFKIKETRIYFDEFVIDLKGE